MYSSVSALGPGRVSPANNKPAVCVPATPKVYLAVPIVEALENASRATILLKVSLVVLY